MPNEVAIFADYSKDKASLVEWSIPLSSAAITYETGNGDWGEKITRHDVQVTRVVEWHAECALAGMQLLHTSVTSDPEIRGGRLVLIGTGFTVAQVLAELADSSGVEEVADNFSLNPDNVRNLLDALSLLFERSYYP